MNCVKGDLARIEVPPGYRRTLQDKFVEVGVDGLCDSGYTARNDSWLCRFQSPVLIGRTMVRQCYLLDAWLRPIRDPGDDAVDEMVQRVGKPRTVRTGLPQVALDRLSHNRVQWP